MPISFVAGWTEPIEYILKVNGAALSLTGMTVEIVVRDAYLNLIPTTGVVTKDEGVTGKVSYTPSVADVAKLVPGEYRVRFKVTDTSTQVAFFPHANPEVWTVGR